MFSYLKETINSTLPLLFLPQLSLKKERKRSLLILTTLSFSNSSKPYYEHQSLPPSKWEYKIALMELHDFFTEVIILILQARLFYLNFEIFFSSRFVTENIIYSYYIIFHFRKRVKSDIVASLMHPIFRAFVEAVNSN